MVLYEVLRLYPPALFINRRTHKQTELGGVTYPADVMLVVPIMFIHRDPAPGAREARPRRVQPGEVRRGRVQGVQRPGRLHPLQLGAAHQHRPELRAAGGQAGHQHGPAALRVRALAGVRARARQHPVTPSAAQRSG